MDPVKPQQTPQIQAALEALEQAYAYYTPEPLPAETQAEAEGWVIEYYQAA